MTRPKFVSSAICAVPDPAYNPPSWRHITLISAHTDHRGDVWWFYEGLSVWRKLPNPVGKPVSVKPPVKPVKPRMRRGP
jgi:hypothetical protein